MEVGRRFGRYEIRAVLGSGGMGEVLLAFDAVLRRTVAVKIVRGDKNRPETVARLMAEARAAASLRHANVVTLLDAGEIDGVSYLAMEYVEGDTLRAHIGAGGVGGDVARKLEWLRQVASALAAAHTAGIVHRDIKPDNVIVGTDDAVKVLDFGIAKRIVAPDTEAATSDGPMSVRTAEGRVIGTTAYMAPEQLAGGAPSPKWDQFAWGITAYELLSGTRPSPGSAEHAALLNTFVPGVSPEVALVVARALARSADDRNGSMEEIARALGATTASFAPATPDAPRDTEGTAERVHVAEAAAPARRGWLTPALVALVAFASGAGVVTWRLHRRAVASTATPSGRPSAPSVPMSPSSSSSSLAVVASVSAEPAPAPSTSASKVTPLEAAATTPRGMPCLCIARADGLSLCPRSALTHPSQCRCILPAGGDLCRVPWQGTDMMHATCADQAFGNSMTAKEGGACSGYAMRMDADGLHSVRADGTFTSCDPCTDPAAFYGRAGTPCVGYRNERVPIRGVVSCSNIPYECQGGNQAACRQLARERR